MERTLSAEVEQLVSEVERLIEHHLLIEARNLTLALALAVTTMVAPAAAAAPAREVEESNAETAAQCTNPERRRGRAAGRVEARGGRLVVSVTGMEYVLDLQRGELSRRAFERPLSPGGELGADERAPSDADYEQVRRALCRAKLAPKRLIDALRALDRAERRPRAAEIELLS